MVETLRKSQESAWKAVKDAHSFHHVGLILDRYLEKEDPSNLSAGRADPFESVVRLAGMSNPVYEKAFQRYKTGFIDAATDILAARERLVIGLGAETVLETGLTLHHTYGVPIIPGTAQKGLCSHYCSEVWGREEPGFQRGGKYHVELFGKTGDAGHIGFHDAWPLPESLRSMIRRDVMTVHHPLYYRSQEGGAAPTDFDDPTPIPFLSVTGSFFFAVTCDVAGDVGKAWRQLAMRLLVDAVREWGIGGKTNSGYGRLEVVRPDAHSKATPRTEHKYGEKIRVRRIEDPKGRGRLWFEALDGSGRGTVASTDGAMTEPMAVGFETELVVKMHKLSTGEFNFAWPGVERVETPVARHGAGKPPQRNDSPPVRSKPGGSQKRK